MLSVLEESLAKQIQVSYSREASISIRLSQAINFIISLISLIFDKNFASLTDLVFLGSPVSFEFDSFEQFFIDFSGLCSFINIVVIKIIYFLGTSLRKLKFYTSILYLIVLSQLNNFAIYSNRLFLIVEVQQQMKRSLNVVLTGACGKIAYSLYTPLCSGQILGLETELHLRLVDVQSKKDELRILREELDDCCYVGVSSITIFTQLDQVQAFTNADIAIFLGGMPRKPGMDRNDVFEINAEIFQKCGKYLQQVAKKTCKSIVIANPTNTNCMILASNAPSIPRQNFTALTRLDLNRFLGQTAKLLNCKPKQISNVILWGNHSRKQYCDVTNVLVEGLAKEFVTEKLLQFDLKAVEKIMYERGGFILQKSNGNAYISATKAIIDHLKDWFNGSDRTVSMGVVLSKQLYGIPAGLCYSLPTVCSGNGEFKIIEEIELNEYQLKRIGQSKQELLKQKSVVAHYLLQ